MVAIHLVHYQQSFVTRLTCRRWICEYFSQRFSRTRQALHRDHTNSVFSYSIAPNLLTHQHVAYIFIGIISLWSFSLAHGSPVHTQSENGAVLNEAHQTQATPTPAPGDST